jgi:hypothetical protein
MDYNDTGIYVCILYNYLIKIKNKKQYLIAYLHALC